MISVPRFSRNAARDKLYKKLWISQLSHCITLNDIVDLGYRLMKKNKLHHHFFAGHSLYYNALYLALFALKIPFNPTTLSHNFKHLTRIPNTEEFYEIVRLFELRIENRMPVEYITQQAFYLNHIFYVNEHVLIPRSVMNSRFEDFLRNVPWKNYRVLDLCAGSGCIGISLALMHPHLSVDLADISAEALQVAEVNIARYGLQERVRCKVGNLFESAQGLYDLIITNPPYVAVKDFQKTPLEFKQEPELAFVAGEDGLSIIEKILTNAKSFLNPSGLLIAEVGYATANHLKKRYRKIPFKWFHYKKVGKESWLDKCVRIIANVESVLLCKAKDLP